jgi:hypothetical protein
MFHSLPYEPRKISATEAVLERIYEAAKKGLRGDSMALAAGLTPHEYRALVQLDPIAEYAETKGRADGEAELADVMMTAARSGDTKAAMDMLKHAHRWTAPQSVQVEVNQTISITAALEEAKQRVIEGLIIDAESHILSDGRAEADGDAMGVAGEGRPADVREAGLPVG